MAEYKEKFDVRDLTNDEKDRIENNFTYHPPQGDQVSKYSFLRNVFLHLAKTLCKCAPESRELSIALTKLEEASMWANAAIARNEKVTDDG